MTAQQFHEYFDKGIKSGVQAFQYAAFPEHYGISTAMEPNGFFVTINEAVGEDEWPFLFKL